ncbi:hypothetical protein F511_06824 [Dorcoceras hygrometricum]|uniref:Uncharacterized protein n=1 Tax=Dorcoceras hygrometricum TaxID=472368 RepID=A0A2Z7AA64_9LAMI|nr:hypothetical protein F511_06824 [Dorcoceras hygrometricum]
MRSARTDSPRGVGRNKFRRLEAAAAAALGGGGGLFREEGRPLLGLGFECCILSSHGPTTIAAPESQFRTCPSDHDSIGYPRMSASGESSTTMHRLLHASGSHPISPPDDPKCYLEIAIAKRCRLHKLIRQRFALALEIQQMLFAMRKFSRDFSQDKPAVSHTATAVVQLRSLGVLTAAGCGIGSVHAFVRSNLLLEPSEVEEGEICRRDQSPVVTFFLPAPATTIGALPTGPPPGRGGSNVTDLASNRDLTREIWSLQVDAPAILCRRDHLLVFAFVLPDTATNAGALPAGSPPVPGGSNGTNHSHNRARTKENERWEGDARDTHKHTLRGVRHQAIGSTTIPPLPTTTSHS